MRSPHTIRISFFAATIALGSVACQSSALAQAPTQNTSVKQVGTIKAIAGDSITLATDSGTEVTVQIGNATRMARVAPGQTDLKGATVIHPQDLQVGDRILLRGTSSEDGKTIAAAVVIVMKASDVQARQDAERLEWQRHGIGGLVSAVDPATGTVTISFTAAGGKKSVLIHTTSTTMFRRYAPDSVRFDDAQPSSIEAVHAGDQLRARGTRSADGSEFAAAEVVAGTFRNIAGTITSIDPATNTLVVRDLASKKDVAVKIAADSELRKLPAPVAQMIAMRFKASGSGGSSNPNPSATPSGDGRPASQNSWQGSRGQASGGGGGRGAADFQQIVNRTPPAQISDLAKGDAVMIVSTEGSASGAATAITLVAGVEPILQASPGGQMMTLSPWSLGASSGGEETGGGETPQQ
ncbi:MAG TPA: DUF5666 domain-containing protein [Candidatus Cybelea sp.]|nr:DUF5666 domain-containing protein [Candidatus Cybelea sp.]